MSLFHVTNASVAVLIGANSPGGQPRRRYMENPAKRGRRHRSPRDGLVFCSSIGNGCTRLCCRTRTETPVRPAVGLARVGVADVGREQFQESGRGPARHPRRLARGGDVPGVVWVTPVPASWHWLGRDAGNSLG